MGTLLADSNEAMRCEYISAILHASLYIVKRITNKELTLAPQLEVVGEESTGRVDYAIKALEELICITEGKLHQVVMGFAQNLIQCKSALQVNKNKRKRKSGEAFGEDYDSSQRPRNGISSFLPRTEYHAQVKVLLISALPSLPWKKVRRKKKSCIRM